MKAVREFRLSTAINYPNALTCSEILSLPGAIDSSTAISFVRRLSDQEYFNTRNFNGAPIDSRVLN